jgi:hypothetical protein
MEQRCPQCYLACSIHGRCQIYQGRGLDVMFDLMVEFEDIEQCWVWKMVPDLYQ